MHSSVIDIQRVCEYIVYIKEMYKSLGNVMYTVKGEGLYLVYFVHKQLYFSVVKLETTGTANFICFSDAKYV